MDKVGKEGVLSTVEERAKPLQKRTLTVVEGNASLDRGYLSLTFMNNQENGNL